MKKLALTAVSLLIAGSASAADLRRPVPMKAAPAPIAVGYNWTGCYIGAGGGYGMWNQDNQLLVAAAPFGIETTNGGRGWFGTVQVGCDYQVGSNIVIGAFGDYDFSGIKGDMNLTAIAFHGDEKLKSSWAAGGRIGWVPFQAQQLLVYVAGGYTEARFGQVDLAVGGAPIGQSVPKHTYSGWFIGSGYEYGLGFLPGLFWKTEYRFADYSADVIPIVVTATGAPTAFSVDSQKYVQTIRSEIVWRFNFGGAPIAARY
jgi:outer membrane immunogenic protein